MNKVEQRYTLEIDAFGEKVRKHREYLGLSQLDLELASGINRTEISRIENGQKNVEFMTIVRLAIALDIELYNLFI